MVKKPADLLETQEVEAEVERIFVFAKAERPELSASKIAIQIRAARRHFLEGELVELDDVQMLAAGLSRGKLQRSDYSQDEVDQIAATMAEMANAHEELAKDMGLWKGGRREDAKVRRAVTLLAGIYRHHTSKAPTADRDTKSNVVNGPFAEFVKSTFSRLYWGEAPPWTAIDTAICEVVETEVESKKNAPRIPELDAILDNYRRAKPQKT